MALRAGQLDRRIRLQRPVTATNAIGESVTNYVDVDPSPTWARVVQGVGSEQFVASDVHSAKSPVTFEIRWRRDVGPKWRILFEGFVYEVDHVAEVGRREGLSIVAYARDVTPGGL